MENQLHVLQYYIVIQCFSLLTNKKPFTARSILPTCHTFDLTTTPKNSGKPIVCTAEVHCSSEHTAQLQFFAIPRCLGCYLILHRQVGTAAPFTHVGIIFSICFVGYDEQHNYTYQFLELFLMRSSLFLMSNMLSGSAVIESVVSVDCEITEGCKK